MVNLSQYSMVLPEPLLDDLHELILDGFTWTSTRWFTWTSTRWLWGPSCPPHWAGTRRTLCRTSSPPAPGHRVQTVQYHVHGFFKIIVGMIWRKWLLGSTVHSVQWDVNCGGGGRDIEFNLCWSVFWHSIAEPVFVHLLRSPGIDPQPGGIDSWAP